MKTISITLPILYGEMGYCNFLCELVGQSLHQPAKRYIRTNLLLIFESGGLHWLLFYQSQYRFCWRLAPFLLFCTLQAIQSKTQLV